ncbi:hypothetical protein AwDysgo_19940 [Bacteroidales bacterium]|nr:hypothetical protein AwDysgo_19940 [Bacteroidales bacterium]
MKIKYIIPSLLLMFSTSAFFSCNDDFMEKNPLDKVVDENFWRSESDMKLYLNVLYPKYIIGHQSGWANSRSYPSNLTGSPLMYGDVYSDNAVKSGSEDVRMSGKLVVPTSGGSTGWSWGDLRNVNYFLARYNRAEISQDLKNKWAAEAYFFKACDYFNKVVNFGDVPWLVRDLNVDSPELYASTTPRHEVMDSILWCINQAVQYLPEKGKEEVGRLNKDQANFLKSRICLFEGTFRKYHTELGLQSSANKFLAESLAASNALISGKKYSLFKINNKNIAGNDSSYWSMFASEDASKNPEGVLVRLYKSAEVGHAAQRYYNANTVQPTQGATRGLVDEYLCIDGNPIYTGGYEGNYVANPLFLGYGKWTELENRDPRLTQTICRPGEYQTIYVGAFMDKEKNGIRYPTITYNGGGSTVTGYRIIKHWMGSMVEQDRVTNGIQSAIEFRYAETLLNYAEAKYELEGTLTQEDIDMTINALRERVGFDFVKYPQAKLSLGKEPADPRLDKIYQDKLDYAVSPMLREIRRERRVELAIENRRYQDLMRWKAGNLFTVPLRGIKFTAELQKLYDGTNTTIPEIAPKTTLGINVYADSEGFLMAYPRSANVTNGILPWENYRYYWPIPKEEFIMNTNLKQREGWENK